MNVIQLDRRQLSATPLAVSAPVPWMSEEDNVMNAVRVTSTSHLLDALVSTYTQESASESDLLTACLPLH